MKPTNEKSLKNQSSTLEAEQQRLRKTNLKVDIAPRSPDIDARWTELRIAGKNIHPRSFHTCVAYNQCLFVYGGYEVDYGILGDFWVLDLANEQGGFLWELLPKDKPNYPGKLRSHSAVVSGDSMYIFGGQRTVGHNNSTTYVYSFLKKDWRCIPASTTLPALDSHSACLYGQSMLIFGGYVADEARHNQSIYSLDLKTEKWSQFYSPRKGQINPQPRSCSGVTNYEKTVWLFGGTDGVHTLNDFWQFDLQKKQWEKLGSQNNLPPQPRRNTSLTYFNGHLFVFGGIQDVTKEKNDIYVYEVATGRWSKIHSSTNSIYECSPTLKKKTVGKGHQRKSSSPIRSTRGGIIQLKSSGVEEQHSKEKTGKLTKEEQSLVMRKIIEQTKHKKFIEKKREMLKEFEEVATQDRRPPRKLSPTSENMKKTLEVIGDQEFSMEPLNHEVRYDETGRYILGKKPCARDGHSATLYKSSLLIFGGDRHLMSFCDLYSFDLEKGLQSKALYQQKQKD